MGHLLCPKPEATDRGYRARVRTFPFLPRSSAQLEVGDFWTIPLSDGDLDVLQVRAYGGRAGISVIARRWRRRLARWARSSGY